MDEWENEFSKSLQLIEASERSKAGLLLSAIPDQEKWNAFLASAKFSWHIWRKNLDKYPKCLLILYGGLSFYEYDDNTFWPQFSRAVGETELISSNQQNDINSEFLKSAKALGLYIQKRDNGLSYVGSSIYHIGIPLSLWDSFIEICEWALWENNWDKLDNNEWKNSIERQVGGRRRLKRFLVENREAASEFIREMIEARQRLNQNLNLTLADISTVIKLRHEYIDLVPETAEFLRPQNPESLMRDSPQLFWDENADRISLLLPSVKKEKLPAEWIVGDGLHQEASTSPDEFILNSVAFNSLIDVRLKPKNDQKSESRFLRGIMPCGLFDHERRAFVDTSRKSLPIRAYTLISPEKLQDISREGFEKDEYLANQEYELEDGTKCHITHLWPIEKNARVSFVSQGVTKNFVFHPNAKVETRLFVGAGGRSANFRIYPKEKDRIITLTSRN